VVTPELPAWKRESLELRERLSAHLSKVYPEQLTVAQEGPDRRQARLRAAAIIESEGAREGEGDRTGDETSLDRKLAHRLYLVLREGGAWRLPQVHWSGGVEAPTVRQCLGEHLSASCGARS